MVKKIKVRRWTTDGKEETTMGMINALIMNTPPAELPQGIEAYRILGRIAKAFDDVTDEILQLDDSDYDFIKEKVDKRIPAVWAFSKEISAAVDGFLNPE